MYVGCLPIELDPDDQDVRLYPPHPLCRSSMAVHDIEVLALHTVYGRCRATSTLVEWHADDLSSLRYRDCFAGGCTGAVHTVQLLCCLLRS